MQTVDKFTDLENIYQIYAPQEDEVLDYVWRLALLIHQSDEKEVDNLIIYGSYAIPLFKERYNNRLIKMPLSYEEYKKNTDIQPTITGLGIDTEKFWFLLLFIWDYTQGQCFNAEEIGLAPLKELKNFIDILSQYKTAGEDALTEEIKFSKDVTLSIQVNGKEKQTIKAPNTIGLLLSLCKKEFDSFCDMEMEDMIEICRQPQYETTFIASQNNQIHFFIDTFKLLLQPFPNGIITQNKRSRDSMVSYNTTFLISRLIYLTGISTNENFYTDKYTLKGYLSKDKFGGLNLINRIY